MVKITPATAQTVQINTKDHSYGIFCFNELGDLFLNSDWGFYGFSWRSFGSSFRDFLAQTNADYIAQKFENNYRQMTLKAMPAIRKSNVTVLLEVFIAHLKNVQAVEIRKQEIEEDGASKA